MMMMLRTRGEQKSMIKIKQALFHLWYRRFAHPKTTLSSILVLVLLYRSFQNPSPRSRFVDVSTVKVSEYLGDVPNSESKQSQLHKPVTAEINQLEARCSHDEVPPFITFAVTWTTPKGLKFWKQGGRWGPDRIAQAVRILYSSLSRTFNCAVDLHVHTNYYNKNPINTLLQNNVYTTMGTRMNGLQFHPLNYTAWRKNVYMDTRYVTKPSKWIALSRSKLDTMESHLGDNLNFLPVWTDLDTLILHPAAVMIDTSNDGAHRSLNRPWAIGYHHQQRNICAGDLFSLDQQTIDDIRKLEQELISNSKKGESKLPEYDLQGYFTLLLDHNSTRMEIVQEHYPDMTFGFDCSNDLHPSPERIQDAIKFNDANKNGSVTCAQPRLLPETPQRPIACISFTAPTYSQTFFEQSSLDSSFDFLEDKSAANALKEFLFTTRKSPLVVEGWE